LFRSDALEFFVVKIFAIPMLVGVADSVATVVHFKAKKQIWSGLIPSPPH
jgi:hypothetical protein